MVGSVIVKRWFLWTADSIWHQM